MKYVLTTYWPFVTRQPANSKDGRKTLLCPFTVSTNAKKKKKKKKKRKKEKEKEKEKSPAPHS